jgi:hypothetical protein
MKTAGKDCLFERDMVWKQLKDASQSDYYVSAIAQAQVGRWQS